MSASSLHRLKKNHEIISRLIAKRQRSRDYDPAKLSELKKVRLSIKDRIAELKATSNPQPSLQ